MKPNHHRRSIRIKGYDYGQAGLCFITLCCHDRICRFGHVENGIMVLNEWGRIAHAEWLKTSELRPKCPNNSGLSVRNRWNMHISQNTRDT